MGSDVQGVLTQLTSDNAGVRAVASAILAFLFVQAIKMWPAAKAPDWRPRAIAIGTALVLNLMTEYVQMETAGAVPLWGRATLLGFAAGVFIVVGYPVIKPLLAKSGSGE